MKRSENTNLETALPKYSSTSRFWRLLTKLIFAMPSWQAPRQFRNAQELDKFLHQILKYLHRLFSGSYKLNFGIRLMPFSIYFSLYWFQRFKKLLLFHYSAPIFVQIDPSGERSRKGFRNFIKILPGAGRFFQRIPELVRSLTIRFFHFSTWTFHTFQCSLCLHTKVTGCWQNWVILRRESSQFLLCFLISRR